VWVRGGGGGSASAANLNDLKEVDANRCCPEPCLRRCVLCVCVGGGG
jgi:hypothetical protein